MASLVHGENCVAAGSAPIVIAGELRKKSKWIGAWLLRRFELHEDKTIQYFHPLSGKLLGRIYLTVGNVRCVHYSGTGCELQIRDAKNKVFFLQAPNIETRDTWCYYVSRVLTGSSGKPVASAAGGVVSFGRAADSTATTDVNVEMDVDLVIPTTYNPDESDGTLHLPLADGRALTMAVPVGTASKGQVVRATVNSLAQSDSSSSLSSSSAKSKLDLNAPVTVCEDSLEHSNVPILVPCCRRPVDSWVHTIAFFSATQAAAAGEKDVVGGGGGGGRSGGEVWTEEMPAAVADIEASSHVPAAGGVGAHKNKASVFSTGKYDMAMLLKLGKLESSFKESLAELWECEDEDELPDQLQELDFNDILGVAESAVERSTWLLLLLTGTEDYREDMAERLEALVHRTVDSIQALEADC